MMPQEICNESRRAANTLDPDRLLDLDELKSRMSKGKEQISQAESGLWLYEPNADIPTARSCLKD